jgi:hypothetical protein
MAAGEAIVTGVGRDPYELALREARRQHGAAMVVLGEPPREAADEAWRELLPERHVLVWSERHVHEQDVGSRGRLPSGRRHDEVRLRERDLLIGRLADRAWAIAVRRGGIMAAVAAELRQRGCAVDEGDRCGGASRGEREARNGIDPASSIEHPASVLQSRIHPIAQPLSSYLTHYTREPDGAWPGETRGEYLDWLIDGPLGSRRDAVDALKRILDEGRIHASGRLMPGREPMISFTAAPPEDVAKLRRFRASLHRWDFRPYGIAIRRDVLERLGAHPVRYLSEAELKRLPPDERLFAQKHEPPGTNWSSEEEWRLRGDLRLAELPREAVVVLAPTQRETEMLAARLGCGVCVLGAVPSQTAGNG